MSESPVPRARGSISPSKLNTLACPHRFNELHNKGKKEPENRPMAHGALIHKVSEDYLVHLKTAGRQSDHAFLEATSMAAFANRPAVIPEEAFADHELFTDELRNFTVDPKTIAGVEQRVAFDENWQRVPWDSPNVAYAGMIDLTTLEQNGHQYIHARDWTTAVLSAHYAKAKELQLRFYGLLLHKLTNKTAVKVTAHSLRTGAQRSVELGKDDHAATEERVTSERLRVLQMTEWPAVPGNECAFCKLECPYEQATAERIRPTDEFSPADVHRDLIMLERKRKVLMGMLKGYVGAYGDLETNGVLATFKKTQQRSYPVGDFIQLLQSHGIVRSEVLNVLSVNNVKLKRVVKGNKELEADLDALVELKDVERFMPLAKAAAQDEDDDSN